MCALRGSLHPNHSVQSRGERRGLAERVEDDTYVRDSASSLRSQPRV